jgi:hypothetical protein
LRFEVGFVPLLWSIAWPFDASWIVLHNGCIILYLVLVQQLDWIIPGLWSQSSRKELVADIQELKRKVTGAMKEEGLWGTWATRKDAYLAPISMCIFIVITYEWEGWYWAWAHEKKRDHQYLLKRGLKVFWFRSR